MSQGLEVFNDYTAMKTFIDGFVARYRVLTLLDALEHQSSNYHEVVIKKNGNPQNRLFIPEYYLDVGIGNPMERRILQELGYSVEFTGNVTQTAPPTDLHGDRGRELALADTIYRGYQVFLTAISRQSGQCNPNEVLEFHDSRLPPGAHVFIISDGTCYLFGSDKLEDPVNWRPDILTEKSMVLLRLKYAWY